MKLNYWLVAVVIVISLLLSSLGIKPIFSEGKPKYSDIVDTVVSQNVSEGENRINFGYITDAYPISSSSGYNSVDGYCGEILNLLRFKNYEVQSFKVDYQSRFNGYVTVNKEKIKLAVECGPNTITTRRKNKLKNLKIDGENYSGLFSEAFFTTGAKLLVSQENKKFFYADPPFKGKKIAVIGAKPTKNETQAENITTTEGIVESVYPYAEIEEYANEEAIINAMNNPNGYDFAAYASDEILLKGLLKKATILNENKYSIVPRLAPLSYEQYGIVIYGTENEKENLKKIINYWITNPDGQEARKKYLEKSENWLDALLTSWYRRDLKFFLLLPLLTLILLAILIYPFVLSLLLKIFPNGLAKRILGNFYNLRAGGRPKNSGLTIIFSPIFYTPMNRAKLEIITKSVPYTIDQIPDDNNSRIKELLKRLQNLINTEEGLDDENKAEASLEVIALAEAAKEAAKNPTEREQNLAKRALTMLQAITAGVSDTNSFVNECGDLLTSIREGLGLTE